MSQDDDDPYPMRAQQHRAPTHDLPEPPDPAADGRPRGSRRFRPGFLATLSFVLTAFLVGAVLLVSQTLPNLQRAINAGPDESLMLTVLDAEGNEIGSRGKRTTPTVPLGEMPPYLIMAVLATEDRRFYEHNGFDPRGIARAMWSNLKAFEFVEGGSTITQQVAKNLYLDNSRTVLRKAQEALITLWLENNLSKDEILTLYLNRIYMGAGNYGMDAAARYYFGKSVRDVSLPEAAILAGLPKAPSRFSPSNDLERARTRASQVLDRLVTSGTLTAQEVAGARANPADVVVRARAEGQEYFVDWVAGQVAAAMPGTTGRYTVRTTLDPRRQKAATAAIEKALADNGEERRLSQGAFVALGPDGAVLAMVGGRSYLESQFNRASQALRQPGSAFKPIVYLAALEAGYTPDSPVTDEPVSMGGWVPRNAAARDWGTVSLATALAHSINTIAVQVGDKVGLDRIGAVAQRLGLERPLPRNLSVVLGSSEVTLLELTSAYSVFGNEGRRSPPYGIVEIVAENGDTVFSHTPESVQATKPEHAHDMTYMLYNVMTEGTGRAAQIGGRLAAGKTGTSQDNRDAWFIGYTGNETAGVWFGNDDNSPTDGAAGGNVAATAWKAYMSAAQAGQAPAPLPGAVRYRDATIRTAVSAPSGFFAELSDLFSAAPKLEGRSANWGQGFRRGGETLGGPGKR
ncbi:MAG: hypothetical protein CVT72_14120 [Alphaproteobacteria bacterium HGW-Alphaproteobacteria-11]|nr:MAG: hypothetical protein CVT72_14120 [Alphaproteobacteria bacterium HGW-Alphaproteobacteria-11]